MVLTFNIAYKIYYFLGKKIGGTRHLREKNEPTLDHILGGGERGKACWLIAYYWLLSTRCFCPELYVCAVILVFS